MKKIAIIGLSVLLSACASETYITEVKSESYREDFQTQSIPKPLMASESAVVEKTVAPKPAPVTVAQQEKKVIKLTPEHQTNTVKIAPPSKKQQSIQRFGYTIQVVAVGSQAKVDQFAKQLPTNGQPIWENYKVVNGTKWYSVLYGDYATNEEAKLAIDSLPAQFKKLKPFVKSIDSIKKSNYPTLNKLN
jgi:septal ring-binding cell division protein DamX